MVEQLEIPTESSYRGNSDDYGRRNGIGTQSWLQDGKEQKYNGEFFQDCMHGEGSYEWTKGKGKEYYEGNFYSNAKEGYGVVSLQNKATFEGLFFNNRPFGPGVLTYENGRQDAGFWSGTKIIRLSRVVDHIIPRLASSLDGKIKLFPYRRILYLHEELDAPMEITGRNYQLASRLYSSFLSDYRSLFFNRINYDKVYFKNLRNFNQWDLIDDSSEKESNENKMETDMSASELTELATADDQYESKHKDLKKTSALKIVCWNRSEICAEMVKQIFHFRSFEGRLSFKISYLIEGNRTSFKKTGQKEKECLQFLKMCSVGPAAVIKEFLCSFNISEELMDARGNNSLMFAAANDQHEIIDILLDHGVDVDSFNDEHLTALNLCLLRLIAQTYKLLNWEIAFLPPKAEKEEKANEEIFQGARSIKSLDRVFGDGMSLIEITDVDVNLSQMELEGEDGGNLKSDLEFKVNRNKPSESIWKMIPELFKMEEYLDSVAKPTERDKYFFDLSPEPEPEPAVAVVDKKKKKGKQTKEVVVEEVVPAVEEELVDEEKVKKCEEIEKTIRKLLGRGADPNISEIPKPSIHLGVFAKNPKVVDMLLRFGASANARCNLIEGFLTPLHIVVLTKPAEEFVDICEILIENGGDSEAETAPEFDPNGEREIFLDPNHGRTPLQLLCMRPDLQYVDPKGYLLEIALLLAEVSNKKHRFKGYGYLTLAMLRGNVKLVEVFLKTGSFDPNEVLKTHGTPLHVLVSTFLQVRVPFEESLKMCDLLLDSGANLLKSWKQGSCVEFGYREIEKEKEKRAAGKGKGKEKEKKKDEVKGRDHLKDHIKIVEYLRKKAKIASKDLGIEFEKEILKETPRKIVKEPKKVKEKMEEEIEEKEKEMKVKGIKEEKKRKGELSRRKSWDDKEKKSGGSGINFDKGSSRITVSSGVDEEVRKMPDDVPEIYEKRAEDKIKKGEKKAEGKKITKKYEKGVEKEVFESKGEIRRSDEMPKALSEAVSENMKRKREKSNESGDDQKKKTKKSEKMKKALKVKLVKPRLEVRKFLRPKEKFEEIPLSLQKLLYDLLGTCRDVFNLNDLLLPYVVLRDGDLYYRFKGQKPKNTEAYSLI